MSNNGSGPLNLTPPPTPPPTPGEPREFEPRFDPEEPLFDPYSMVVTPHMEDLSVIQQRYVWFYVCGPPEVRGVQYKAYQMAQDNGISEKSASVCASQYMKTDTILSAIDQLRTHVNTIAERRLVPWGEVSRRAQLVLLDAIEGRITLSETRFKSCKEALDRHLGRPVQPIEADIGETLDSLMRDLASSRPTPTLPPALSKKMAEGDIAEAEYEVVDDE